jgi:nicotinamidase/pyrazinamidase
MKALILVDIQNDFLPKGALAVPAGNEVIEIANQLMTLKGKVFQWVIATQDWHPHFHKSFASQHRARLPGETIHLNGLSQVLWPDHCIQNTFGAEFANQLVTSKLDWVVKKGTDPEIDSYSGFFDNGHRKSTGLGEKLSELGVKEVYILGLATDYCVKYTALDAVALGFQTYLIEDGCRGVNLDPNDSRKSIDEMKKTGIQVLQSKDLH